MAEFFQGIANNLTTKKVFFILFTLTFCIYFNSLFNEFVWDDEEQIVKNPIITSVANLPQILSGGTFSTGGGSQLSGWFFRPMLSFIFFLNFRLFGLHTFGYHLFQVLVHALNGFLIFLLLQKLVNKHSSKKLTTLNFLLALIFIVHPGINEAVVYISAVNDPIYTTFTLGAFLLISSSRNSLSINLAIYILLMLALLSKESAMAFFPILWVFAFLFNRKILKRVAILSFLTIASYLFLRFVIFQIPFQHPNFSVSSEATLVTRIITLPKILWSYITLFFFPHYLSISQHFLVKNMNFLDFFLPLGLNILFLGSWFYLFLVTKKKVILFGLAWFLISFGVITNIFPLDMTVAERWFYFPIIGIFIGLGGILSLLQDKSERFWGYVVTFFIIILIVLSVRTIVRSSNWTDGLTLYSHDEKITPNSFDLENNLGVELFRTGKILDAKVHFEKSLSLQPKWYFSQSNLGAVYQRLGDNKKAKEQYKLVLKDSDYYLAHENMASILLSESTSEAKVFAENSLRKLPNNSQLWTTLAIADYRLGNQKEALKAAENAYLLNPSTQTQQLYLIIKDKKPLN